MPTVLTVAAVRLLDGSGRILLVRKRGTTVFMQPGGKLEPGEAPNAAALRELHEELGLVVAPRDLVPLGDWSGPAANEADTDIRAHLFGAMLDGEPRVAAELEEMVWESPESALRRTDIAPLLRDHVLPELLRTRHG
ncbi:NUDIX hydrolase [Arthrobacter sp. KK5.5]|uniref:NUDIX hydrolase n=1 Tax=Arthrobacter sp. KK5.5 TaxID=3373084 RepID=UPI003EE4F4DB